MLFGPRTFEPYNHEKSASNTISINILDLFFLAYAQLDCKNMLTLQNNGHTDLLNK